MSKPVPATVLLVSSDLATSSKVAGAGARQRVQVITAASAATIAERASSDKCALAIIDLSTPGLDVGAVVTQLRASRNHRRRSSPSVRTYTRPCSTEPPQPVATR